jgi:hypothetical protein
MAVCRERRSGGRITDQRTQRVPRILECPSQNHRFLHFYRLVQNRLEVISYVYDIKQVREHLLCVLYKTG